MESFPPHSVKSLRQVEEGRTLLSIPMAGVFNVLCEECKLIFCSAVLT